MQNRRFHAGPPWRLSDRVSTPWRGDPLGLDPIRRAHSAAKPMKQRRPRLTMTIKGAPFFLTLARPWAKRDRPNPSAQAPRGDLKEKAQETAGPSAPSPLRCFIRLNPLNRRAVFSSRALAMLSIRSRMDFFSIARHFWKNVATWDP